jgi:hypothetical protein
LKSEKRTFEEMVELAYSLQEAVTALCGRRPLRITTNKDYKLLRIVWMRDFEKKEWYDGVSMKILIQAFMDKHGIHIREIPIEESKESAVYLTKKDTDPAKKRFRK